MRVPFFYLYYYKKKYIYQWSDFRVQTSVALGHPLFLRPKVFKGSLEGPILWNDYTILTWRALKEGSKVGLEG